MPWWEDDPKLNELKGLEKRLWDEMCSFQESEHVKHEEDLHSLLRLSWLEARRRRSAREESLRQGAVLG